MCRAHRSHQPNGIAVDLHRDNIIVVKAGDPSVLTFSHGQLLKTETAAQAGSDGLIIMRVGTN